MKQEKALGLHYGCWKTRFRRRELHPESSPCQEHRAHQRAHQAKVQAYPGALLIKDPTTGSALHLENPGFQGPWRSGLSEHRCPAALSAQPLTRFHKIARARESRDIPAFILLFWRWGNWAPEELGVCPGHTANKPLSWGSNPCCLLWVRFVFFPYFFFFNHKRK